MRNLVLSLLGSQWELRQQHDQNFPTEGKPLEQILTSEEKTKSKSQSESQSGT